MKKYIFAVSSVLILGIFIFFNSCSSALRTAPVRQTPGDLYRQLDTAKVNVMRIGYATVLINTGKDNLLVDPWFSEKAAYYHGKDSLAMEAHKLPKLTAIASSQDHYDHFDIETLSKSIDKNVPLIVCSDSKQREKAEKFGFTNIFEPKNFETLTFGQFRITSFESKTDEKPRSFDYERNYIIETNGKTILYVGHIMEESVQNEIAKRFPTIDLVFIPVNNLRIKINFNEQKAFSPQDAADLCMKLKPKVAIPIHYNFEGSWLTNNFLLGQNGTPEKFQQIVKERKLNTGVMIMETGLRLPL